MVFAIPVETSPYSEMHSQLLLPNDLQSSRTSSSTDLEKIQEQQRAAALLKAVLQSSDSEEKDALLPASDNVESPNTTEEMALDMRYAVVMTTIPPRFVRIYLHMIYPSCVLNGNVSPPMALASLYPPPPLTLAYYTSLSTSVSSSVVSVYDHSVLVGADRIAYSSLHPIVRPKTIQTFR